ncbi:alpha-amylase family glycosyl hydrolase [Shewanella sp. 1CM18E]|uniref:alpha-amylase family glycosyl hydrolase n=1 Tax=Shewanella sp. 1CM18E TaxID=2929169 RepID=UPI0020C03D94|nr:alpha-amylase family glycosyl hydrolase [Shewanella sp. 1CM18E]MCK8044317.1 alpha-amylase family glycosyl hydrolase [Shewanella sp. 1CM18E]
MAKHKSVTHKVNLLHSALLMASMTVAATPSVAEIRADTALVGTNEPFASNAVYFVVTDRFVDGDKSNNYPQDSGYMLPISLKGEQANVGFMGGDFKGLLEHADYIREMGFNSIWMTPIVENPAQAFSGGDEIKPEGFAMDRNKAAYHGYWGTNFYKLDKHLPSANLDYQALNKALADKGLSTILDVVLNHGSPAYTMSAEQAKSSFYGKLFDKDNNLVADHQNLAPQALKANEPLHAWFNNKPDLAQLADMDTSNPEVMDYFVGANLQWLQQGASAFRIDTVKHVPKQHWGEFTRKIRQQYPNLFMFGEVYSFDADEIGQYTQSENGGMSVLDFPLKAALNQVFADGADYHTLLAALYLKAENNPYRNPYDLLTFYDNHDMPRMAADDNGFIDAHNWLFTARGIPVIYYGSEMGFERGKGEHFGNRNYYGEQGVQQALTHPIRNALIPIAALRQSLPSLQRGLQVNLDFTENTAAFYRILQQEQGLQISLVLLNKSDVAQAIKVEDLPQGEWREPLIKQQRLLATEQVFTVPAHGVRVLVLDNAVLTQDIKTKLSGLYLAE